MIGKVSLAVAPAYLTHARRRWAGQFLIGALLAAVAVVTFVTAARDEDFWWGDGASFALNGEFLRDYIASGLGRSPMAFAAEWYFRYPALTISLYPPIFPLAEAAVFAVFGFSHNAAQATVTIFTLLALFGVYWTVRTSAGALCAAGAAVLLVASPEVLRWSREIVMEIPALAFLLLAAAALLRYQAAKSTRRLIVVALLLAGAIHTKQTAIFVVPAFAAALLIDEGVSLTRRWSTWIVVATAAICLVPLAIFTFHFSAENFNIAFGPGTGEKGYDRLSIRALTRYGRSLPEIVGYIPLLGTAAYLGLVAKKGWRDRAERRLAVLMLAWFFIDYVLVSVTADFEIRYATFLAVPFAVLSMLPIARLPLPAGAAALIMSLCLYAGLLSRQPVVRVEGYNTAAQFVLEQSEQNDVVLFHGAGSKNFTFSVRVRSPKSFSCGLKSFSWTTISRGTGASSIVTFPPPKSRRSSIVTAYR